MQEDGSLEDKPEVARLKLVLRLYEVEALAPGLADECLLHAAARVDPALANRELDDIKLALKRFIGERS